MPSETGISGAFAYHLERHVDIGLGRVELADLKADHQPILHPRLRDVDAAIIVDPVDEGLLRRLIRDAGFIPKQRDTLYRTYYLN